MESDKKDMGLTALGSGHTEYKFDGPYSGLLERFPSPMVNQFKHRGIRCEVKSFSSIQIVAPEFTSVCPITGQPDYAQIVVDYKPHEWCVESKSFKLYLNSFRHAGMFHEMCVETICSDLFDLLNPYFIKVQGQFTPRGGIKFWPTSTKTNWDVDTR